MLPVHERSTECCTGATPLPESETAAGELVALLTNETEPENGPLVSGAKVTLTVLVVPAAMVIGKLTVALKTPPVKLAAETETDELPVLERVIACVELFPTSTLPNATLVGDALSNSVEGVVAAPDRLTTGGVFEAVLATASVPEKLPVVVGAKRTESVADWPAEIVNGNVTPVVLKPLPVTVAPVTDMLVVPELEMVTFWVDVVFATMLPNETDVGETAIVATGALTVIAADADLVVSATLTALTVYAPAVLGAVYRPEDEIEPPVADQLTDVLLEPVTVAANCFVPPVVSEAAVGLI